MELTLPATLADHLIETAGDWEQIVTRLESDPDLWGTVTRLLKDGPKPTDLFGAPLWIPEDWLFDPTPPEPGTKISVTAAGQVSGYFFEWGECVIRGGGPGDCWTPVPSPSGYEPFHQSDAQVITASGKQEIRPAGLIGIGGHAPANASFQAAVSHYQFPERGRMIMRAYENEIGGYVKGALLPSATFADVAMIRASALSGHWEYRERFHDVKGAVVTGYDCLGPCMVGSPGLPLTRGTRYNAEGVVASARGVMKHRRITSSITAMVEEYEHGFEQPDGKILWESVIAMVTGERYDEVNDVMREVTLGDDGSYVGESVVSVLEEHEIEPERARPDDDHASIGFSETEQLWYGWSHRAIYGYGVGYVVKDDDWVGIGQDPDIGVGFEAKTLEDAKRLAIAHADGVA